MMLSKTVREIFYQRESQKSFPQGQSLIHDCREVEYPCILMSSFPHLFNKYGSNGKNESSWLSKLSFATDDAKVDEATGRRLRLFFSMMV